MLRDVERLSRNERPVNQPPSNINAKEFQSISVPVPPVELQREFVAIANAAEASKAELKKSITSIDAVMKGLING